MAQLLMRQWHLAVLRVRLDLSERKPSVVTELLAFPDGTETVVWWQGYPMEAFGLPHTAAVPLRDLDLRIPDHLRAAVVDALEGQFAGEAALWLHLVPPYGYLGAIPWEQALVPAMGVPLLRVPDRLPVASDPGTIWSLAIVLNAAPDAAWPETEIPAFLMELAGRVQSPLDVHVFADARSSESISGAMAGRHIPGSVEIHDPHAARTTAADWQAAKATYARPRQSRQLPNEDIWSSWITGTLRGRAVRALHVVSAAGLDGDRPLLALAADPVSSLEMSSATYRSGDDVLRLADAVGAALLSFGSPPDNPSDVATRMLADSVGVRRPGPTLYTSMALDPFGEALASAQAFIANDPGTAPVPAHEALFAYLQPEHVRAALAEPWPEPMEPDAAYPGTVTSPGDDVKQLYASADTLPGWVATSERYIDANIGELAQTSRTRSAVPYTKQAYDEGKQRALSELREIVDRHLRGK